VRLTLIDQLQRVTFARANRQIAKKLALGEQKARHVAVPGFSYFWS
jgi:hypothetical protein